MNPSVSVIIAVKNGQQTIQACLDSVLRLDYPAFDIIVVDDGSDDRTASIVRGYEGRVTLLANGRSEGPSAARNAAVRYSRADFVAFTDGDCIVEKDWLTRLSQGMALDETVSCGGTQNLPPDATRFERDVFAFLSGAGFVTEYVKSGKINGIVYVAHNPSCSVMYRRGAFLEAGGFLEGLWPGEDVDLDRRLTLKGYRHAFNPGAVVYHYRPRTIGSFLSMMKRYGWAQGFLVRRYGFFRAVHVVPVAMTLYLIAALWWLFAAPALSAAVMGLLLTAGLIYFRRPAVFLLAFLGLCEWYEGFIAGVARPGPSLRK